MPFLTFVGKHLSGSIWAPLICEFDRTESTKLVVSMGIQLLPPQEALVYASSRVSGSEAKMNPNGPQRMSLLCGAARRLDGSLEIVAVGPLG